MFQPFVWQKVAPVLQKSLYPNDFVIRNSLWFHYFSLMMDEKVVFLLHSECITSEQTEYSNMNIMYLSIKILFADGSILRFFFHKYLVPATQNLVLVNLWKWMV